jgi:hypothetical protein
MSSSDDHPRETPATPGGPTSAPAGIATPPVLYILPCDEELRIRQIIQTELDLAKMHSVRAQAWMNWLNGRGQQPPTDG